MTIKICRQSQIILALNPACLSNVEGNPLARHRGATAASCPELDEIPELVEGLKGTLPFVYLSIWCSTYDVRGGLISDV